MIRLGIIAELQIASTEHKGIFRDASSFSFTKGKAVSSVL